MTDRLEEIEARLDGIAPGSIVPTKVADLAYLIGEVERLRRAEEERDIAERVAANHGGVAATAIRELRAEVEARLADRAAMEKARDFLRALWSTDGPGTGSRIRIGFDRIDEALAALEERLQ